MRLLGRFRRSRKTPLAVAAILAMPLFFDALMSISLALEKPTHVLQRGREALGDPSGSTEAAIWSSSAGVALLLLVLGVSASLVPSRLALGAPVLAAIGVAVALRLPLERWEDAHTARYPDGVDLIPRDAPDDLILRGEWEENARRTAEQLGFWTIAIAVAAALVTVVVEARRRRHQAAPPPVRPPAGTVAGGTPT